MKTAYCQACRTPMFPGRRRDKADGWAKSQEAWLPGEPEKEVLGFFTGQGESLPVTTFACPKCGLLQSYIDPAALPYPAGWREDTAPKGPPPADPKDDARRYAPPGYQE